MCPHNLLLTAIQLGFDINLNERDQQREKRVSDEDQRRRGMSRGQKQEALTTVHLSLTVPNKDHIIRGRPQITEFNMVNSTCCLEPRKWGRETRDQLGFIMINSTCVGDGFTMAMNNQSHLEDIRSQESPDRHSLRPR